MQLLPGFNPSIPEPIAPRPPPKRDDPAIVAARERLKLSERKRKGRSATILAGGLGATETARPAGRQANLLGE